MRAAGTRSLPNRSWPGSTPSRDPRGRGRRRPSALRPAPAGAATASGDLAPAGRAKREEPARKELERDATSGVIPGSASARIALVTASPCSLPDLMNSIAEGSEAIEDFQRAIAALDEKAEAWIEALPFLEQKISRLEQVLPGHLGKPCSECRLSSLGYGPSS